MSFEPTTKNVQIYQEGWNDAKADNKAVIDTLRKARRFIQVVKNWQRIQDEWRTVTGLDMVVRDSTEGNEVEAIETALLELGELGETGRFSFTIEDAAKIAYGGRI